MIINNKATAIFDLIRLKKQYGTLLLLAPTLWSLFLASSGMPPLKLLIIFITGTFLMRSAGCVINDIADRDFDRHVERTRDRPLASGRLTVREALFVFCALIALSFVLALFLNPLTIILSLVALFLASLYPFVKRVSYLPQVFLGMAFGWGSVMAWSAVRNEIGIPAILIFIANTFWSTAYDTIYALMDKEDDLKIGVKSTAILFGTHIYTVLYLLFAMAIITLAAAGWIAKMGTVYFAILFAAGFIFEYMVYILRKSPTRETAFRIFIANAGIGLLILAGIAVDYIL
ncbi:MAG: 4-hydroxybenzoate octaprenyltransferase [Deltaproteobacteria bacterium]|nr:4-hydroxybenzoate octaprenyltransferase [Deltaproteobacteria bacterium]